MRGRCGTINGSPMPCSTTRAMLGYWSTIEQNISKLMFAAGSSSSNVRGHVSAYGSLKPSLQDGSEGPTFISRAA
jgi:hypothetical protein